MRGSRQNDMGATVARGALCGCHREERKHQALGAGKEVKVPQKHTLSKISFLPRNPRNPILAWICGNDYQHCGIGATRVGCSAVCGAIWSHAFVFRRILFASGLVGSNEALVFVSGRPGRDP